MKKILPFLPIGFIVAGLILRGLFLLNSPLWYDEAFTVLISRLDIERMLSATVTDVHPPLYYVLISGLFTAFPTVNQALLLRGFSVFCSLVAMFQLWAISGELRLSERARLIALGIMAAAPVELYYAQEGRMYAFLQVLILAQFLTMLRREWKDLTLVSILTLYTHNYGLFYCAVIYAIAILRERPTWAKFYRLAPLWSGLVALLLFVPWLALVTFNQMGMVAQGYWIQPLTLGNLFYSLLQIVWTTVMPDWLIVLAVPALAMVILFAVENAWSERRFELLALAFGPLLFAVVISMVWKPVLLFRGLFGAIPALILLVADASTHKRAWFWISFAAPVLAITVGWYVYQGSMGHIKSQHDTVLPVASARGVMVHLNDSTLLPYAVYRPDMVHLYLEKGCPADNGQLTEETRAALGFQSIRLEDLPNRFYLAATVGPLSTPCEEKVYKQLTAISAPVMVDKLPMASGETIGINGVWSYVSH